MNFFRNSLGLSSPFCPLYLFTAGMFCVAWLLYSQKMTLRAVWNYLRCLVVRHQKAIFIDSLWTIFQFLMLRIPVAAVHLAIFNWAYTNTLDGTGDSLSLPIHWQPPVWIEGLLATALTMLAIDFAGYGLHRAMHTVPLLWRCHRVHHEAQFLTPFTTFRQHPLEPFLLGSGRGLAAGLILGLLHALWPRCTPIWSLGGMGLGFFLYMFTVNLHHAPIPLRYPLFLSSFLISPHIHHLHHSRAQQHHGRNFGVIFCFWDRLFRSYWDQNLQLDELQFGLDDELASKPT